MKMLSCRSTILLIILFTALTESGCASFAGRELPIYTLEQLPSSQLKISATYEVKAYGPKGESEIIAARFTYEIQKILTANTVFAELKEGAGPSDYHVSFVFKDVGMPSENVAFLNGFISGLTLTVIPAYARDIFTITIDVKRGDRVIKTYVYKDHMDSWIQLFLVFLTPFNSTENVACTVIDNMIMNFAHDVGSDIQSGVYVAQQKL
jgi:hypothetical protein